MLEDFLVYYTLLRCSQSLPQDMLRIVVTCLTYVKMHKNVKWKTKVPRKHKIMPESLFLLGKCAEDT